MSCNRSNTVLHGYFDRELGALSAAEFECHLEQCSECVDAFETLRSLRLSIDLSRLYEKTPASLRKRVCAELGTASPVLIAPARKPLRYLGLAATLLFFAYTGWQIVRVHRGDSYETVLAAEVVDAHLRSLQPGHLIDVVSSDQHMIKPWFDGKLNFSPPVRDFADRGFPLQGGRLDVVRDRATAVLVYERRKHLVNVFIWSTSEQDAYPRVGSHQGYHWIGWCKGGMEFCAVSDAMPSDLEQLQRLFTE
jgi:anti-sigma factor RsiW